MEKQHSNIRTFVANKKSQAVALAGSASVLAGSAMAGGGGPDFSGILDGISAATIITAVVGGAAILALVAFAVWGSRKVAGLFGK